MSQADEDPDVNAAPNLASVTQGEVVTIFIGAERTKFTVHRNFICHYSEYFRTAYNGRWKEAQEGVTLEDVEVEVFNIFQPAGGYSGSDISSNGQFLLEACVFGDRFLVPKFRKLAHNTYVNVYSNEHIFPFYEEIIRAFENFQEADLMLKFMVGMQCLQWSTDQDEDDQKVLLPQLPHSFLLRYMLKHGELKDIPDIEKNSKYGICNLNHTEYLYHG